MPAVVNLGFADYGSEAKPYGEIGTVAIPGVSFTAENFNAQNALIATLVNAIKGIEIGAFVSDVRQLLVTAPDTGPAASALAQREIKWLVLYHDTTNQDKYRLTIPCADLTLLEANSETLDITTPLSVGKVFKDAFEAYVHPAEYPAHDVVIDKVVWVPRNA